MFTYLPLYCFILAIFIDLAGLHEFFESFTSTMEMDGSDRNAACFYSYQFSWACAIRAVYRYLKGTTNWEKNCTRWTAPYQSAAIKKK